MEIAINAASCIKCGNCVAVCPAGIFTQKEPKTAIGVARVEACIKCGHCVDVCPTNSVLHSEFPKELQHEVDYTNLPTPEQMMNLIRSRRSNRALSSKLVSDADLATLREAALYAPTAGNNRRVDVKIIDNEEQIQAIIRFTLDTIEANIDKLGRYYLGFVRHARKAIEAGEDPIARKAKQLMVFTSDSPFGLIDANLAYQNASLMAQSMGISQVWMGYIYTATQLADPEKVKELFGFGEKIQAIMALGIPRFRYRRYSERA